MSIDGKLIETCIRYINDNKKSLLPENSIEKRYESKIEHPLDNEILKILECIHNKDSDTDEFFLFKFITDVKDLWKKLIEKSIVCLRFFDTREPFLESSNKHPVAYGIKGMNDYYDKYADFENVLYGGAKYYRDHLVHVVRVWLLGVQYLLEHECAYLKSIKIDENFKHNANEFEFNNLEKISIWTLISLTHDLGYPLEKAQKIIESTRQMMKCFISEPNVFMNMSFNGVQNNMNDYILRFMSSKMIAKDNRGPNRCESDTELIDKKKKKYVTRLQSKYYFKFQKSLENFKHGTISAIVIYKLLLFFLESDFTINEDYEFKHEDARQFYIRRHILRAIASHTCPDVYHLKISTFSVLLIIADDCQEWGRKSIAELYNAGKVKYRLKSLEFNVEDESKETDDNVETNNSEDETDKYVTVSEEYYTTPDTEKIEETHLTRLLKSVYNQFCYYTSLFRDGQDTKHRDFTFNKNCEIRFFDNYDIKYIISFSVANKTDSFFKIYLYSSKLNDIDQKYGFAYLQNVYGERINKPKNDQKSKTDNILFDFNLPKPDDKIE